MTISNIRYTVKQVVNEVQRKLGLSETSSIAANKVSTELVDHINDTVSDISDFGNWMECLATAAVTAQVSVNNYEINVSGITVKNIGDVYIETRRGPLRSIDIDTMRIMTRTTAMGQPTQYCIFGTDTNGNPIIRVRPTPSTTEDGKMFSILYYVKPNQYTTSDGDVVIPFPARVVVLGTLARYTLRESGGSPTPKYQSLQQEYLNARRDAFNRFHGDTGWGVAYVPSRGHKR